MGINIFGQFKQSSNSIRRIQIIIHCRNEFVFTAFKQADQLIIITQNYMLWMQNKLYFNRTPIQEVTRRLERVYNYTIQLDSSFVFNNFLSGTHDNRSLEAVLESIRLATGIKYRKENNSYILYK